MGQPITYIAVEQGAEMGRPSTLYVEVDREGQEITAVRVGGQVVPMAEGVVRFQAGAGAGYLDKMKKCPFSARMGSAKRCPGKST